MRIALSILLQFEANGVNHQGDNIWNKTVPTTTARNKITTNAFIILCLSLLITG
jgi:hypothetical protein